MERPGTLIYSSWLLRIGMWRCPVSYPNFNDTGPTGGYLLVFPRTSVYIEQAGHRPVVADPNVIMYYNRGQYYRRRKLSERGDKCEYFAFSPDVIVDAVRPYDPDVYDRHSQPFTFTHGPSNAALYLVQRLVVTHILKHDRPDPLYIEETMLGVLHSAIAHTYTVRDEDEEPAYDETEAAHAEIVHAVKAYIAAHFGESLTLDEIAAAVHASPYHLCRVFRRQTGVTIHHYLNQMRLRTSLEYVAQGDTSLTEVGLALGYSSPSHFSRAFKREFGMPPSELRRSASRRRLRELSKIVKV